jgi:hypothetical protein
VKKLRIQCGFGGVVVDKQKRPFSAYNSWSPIGNAAEIIPRLCADGHHIHFVMRTFDPLTQDTFFPWLERYSLKGIPVTFTKDRAASLFRNVDVALHSDIEELDVVMRRPGGPTPLLMVSEHTVADARLFDSTKPKIHFAHNWRDVLGVIRRLAEEQAVCTS